MQNDLSEFWRSFRGDMEEPAGQLEQPSSSVVDDIGAESHEHSVQREIERHNNQVDEEFRNMASRFVDRLEKENWKDSGYYISDVYACESAERAQGLALFSE